MSEPVYRRRLLTPYQSRLMNGFRPGEFGLFATKSTTRKIWDRLRDSKFGNLDWAEHPNDSTRSVKMAGDDTSPVQDNENFAELVANRRFDRAKLVSPPLLFRPDGHLAGAESATFQDQRARWQAEWYRLVSRCPAECFEHGMYSFSGCLHPCVGRYFQVKWLLKNGADASIPDSDGGSHS